MALSVQLRASNSSLLVIKPLLALKFAGTQVHCVLITNTESCQGDPLSHGASAAANSLQRAAGSCRGSGASDFRGLRGGIVPGPPVFSPPLETGCSGPFQLRPGLPPDHTGLAVLNAYKRSWLLSAKH